MASIYDKASLVLIPSGTKTSKVYSQKPVNGDGDFTFSRSTAATRVNADGNIEKETQNLLLQSNNFDTTWTNTSSTETSGQSGYDGSNNAWLIEKFTPTGRVVQGISKSGVYSFSVYAKAGTLDGMRLLISGGGDVYFDLGNGTIGNDVASIDAQIESVGNDWYRCSLTQSSSSFTDVRIYPADASSLSSSTGNIYIQDAQVEQGLVARDYIETTTAAVEGGITDNVPRLDYTDSSCPALLLEPQRTNIFVQSEYFTGGDWDLNSGTTLTDNYATSPEGVQNATRYVGTGTSGLGDKYTLVNGTQYTISAYVKSNTGATQYCRLIGDSANVSSDLEVTTEWTRIDYTWTSDGLTSKTNGIFRDSSNNDIDILIFALQLEAGSYATSYIPTYGTSVTRNAEESSKSGVSELIGQTEGTIYAEFFMPNDYTGNEVHRISLSDGSLDNWVFMSIPEVGDETRMYLRIGASTKVDTQTTNSPFTHNQVNKIAYGYKRGDLRIYINGVSVLSSSIIYGSFTLPLSRINITGGSGGSGSTQNDLANNLNQIMVFKTRLSNEELAALTTI